MRLHRAAVAFLLLSSNVNAQIFTGLGFGAIPDGLGSGPQAYGAPRDISFNVSGLAGTVTGVAAGFRANHSFVGNLKVSLIAPDGAVHLLFERTGATSAAGAGSDANLVATSFYGFGDLQTINWWTAANVAGNVDIPDTNARSVISGGQGVSNPPAVTAFNSRFALVVPNGTWRLRFEDGVSGDIGEVTDARLVLTVAGTTRTVTTTADSGSGSLREALTLAQNSDLINFSTLFNTPQRIDLLTALPVITRSISIQGPGAQRLTIRRSFAAATEFRVFDVPGGVSNGVSISGMTISNGRTTDFGGGILSRSPLSLSGVHVTGNTATLGGGVFLGDSGGVLRGSTFSDNLSTGDGGGIFFEGNNADTLEVLNSTVSGNRSAGNSGGIRTTRGRLLLTDSTVVGNTAASAPGGILAVAQTAGNTSNILLRNTIVSANTPDNLAAVSVGGIASVQTSGFNLSEDYNGVFTPQPSDITSAMPRLAPLAVYGGTTPTHALLHGSPAVDAGNASAPVDQRGVARPASGADIGAVELNPVVVTNTLDAGAGSLRDAIVSSIANPAPLEDIVFDSAVFNASQTISLTSGELFVDSDLNVIGPGANLLRVSGSNQHRVFQVLPNRTATLSGVSVVSGNANGDGGGIYNDGTLYLTHSSVAGNASAFSGGGISCGVDDITVISSSTLSNNIASDTGGGMQNRGTLTLTGSTISNNSAQAAAGGLRNLGGGRIWASNSTIAANVDTSPVGGAGGIFSDGASVEIRNSIVSANVGNSAKPDVDGVIVESLGFNLIGNRGSINFSATGDQSGTGAAPLDPLLAPLANNGGTTQTHALLAGSPALDMGERSGASVDQRGVLRPVDLAAIPNAVDGADIGALERAIGLPPTLGYAPAAASTINYGASGSAAPIIVTPSGGSGPLSPPATNTFLGCSISNGGAAFPTTGTASLEFVGDTTVPQSLNLPNCVPQAGLAVNATLTCLELRGSDALVERQWTLACPAGAQNVAPAVSYTPVAGSMIDFPAGAAGPANSTINVSSSGGSGTGIVTVNNCSAPVGFTLNGPINLSGTPTSPINGAIISSCTRGAVAQSGTLSCTETATPGSAVSRAWTLNCPAAQAAGLLVTNTSDSGPGSLRQAIVNANSNGPGPDDIVFSSLFDTAQTITLSSELVVSSEMTILGPGASLLRVSGNDLVRVFRVDSGIFSVMGINVTRGNSGTSPGGAIRINSGEVTLLECHVTDSRAGDGAGILNDGSLTLERVLISGNSTTTGNEPSVGAGISSGGMLFVGNSTVSGNSAQASTRAAGAVLIYGGTASINNSTITNNSATSGSTRIGGILQFAGTLTLRSSIVAGNVDNATIPDVGGAMTASFNLVGNAGSATGLVGNGNQTGTGASPLDPQLGSLSDNGGGTLTHALGAGSPALDAGSNVLVRTRDQRGNGFARVVNLAAANASDGTDIGAFEAQSEPPVDSIFRNGFE